MGIAHWDDVEPRDLRRGPMQLDRIDLGHAAGSKEVGVARLKLDPGGRSSPVHVELDEEEIFYVLGGSGLSWQSGKTYEVRAGDTIVHRVAEEDHTLIAGPDGLDVLAFGERTNVTASYLTRAGVLRMDATVKVAEERHPWDLEADAEISSCPSRAHVPRPSSTRRGGGRARGRVVRPCERRRLGADGPQLGRVAAGQEGPAPLPLVEEEIFVVLEGSGVLELWPTPHIGCARNVEKEVLSCAPAMSSRAPRRRGSPTSSARRAKRLTFLAYGTRRTGDICYYPRSNKINFRGVGIIARLESLDYYDGEPERGI